MSKPTFPEGKASRKHLLFLLLHLLSSKPIKNDNAMRVAILSIH